MDSSSDEVSPTRQAKPKTDTKVAKKKRALSVVFSNKVFDKESRSERSLYSPPQTAFSRNEAVAVDRSEEGSALIRTRSEDSGPRVKEEWAEQIWAHESLKESARALRSSFSDYEKEATRQQWTDLLKVNADVTEFGKLVESSNSKKSKKAGQDESMDGLTKFTTVALEYSKMLDVVMNQSPEYAGLAWGVGGCLHPLTGIVLIFIGDPNLTRCAHKPQQAQTCGRTLSYPIWSRLRDRQPTDELPSNCEDGRSRNRGLRSLLKLPRENS
jgi:hypothetical protein